MTKEVMKTNLVRQYGLGLAAGLVFFLACGQPSAEPELQKPADSPKPLVLGSPGEPVPDAVTNFTPLVANDTNAPAIIERIPAIPKLATVTLSTGLTEVVKLAQAGVSEEVILAFIDQFNGHFEVGADQILYLNDLGIPSAVITSMLKRDGSEAALATTNPPSSLEQTQIVSNVPEQPAYLTPEQVQATIVPVSESLEVTSFYDTLSPYGGWVYLSTYGWCWQPTVAVVTPAWRPYCNRGRWYWSNSGWYWNSDYSWGWAAFHYGRWYNHPGCGWVWAPGSAWGPSWVSWRYQSGYCGWAPLPPEAHYASGVGFSYRGRHVTAGFEFGLTSTHYAFVPTANFTDHAPQRYVVPQARAQHLYHNTTVVNNYTAGNNTVVNRGMGRETLARVSQSGIREVAVREAPGGSTAQVRRDQIHREGDQLVVYRPPSPGNQPRSRTVTATATTRDGASSPPAIMAGRNAPAIATSLVGTRTTQSANPSRPQNGTPTRTTATPGTAQEPQIQPSGRRPQAVGNVTQSRTQPQGQTPHQQHTLRANGPLFGPGTGSALPQRNSYAVTRSTESGNRSGPEVNSQPRQSRAPQYRTMPVYPEAQSPTRSTVRTTPAQPVTQSESHRTGYPATPVNPVASPRQIEQVPRQSAPARSAPSYTPQPRTAPQVSQPAPVRSAPEPSRAAPSTGNRAQPSR